MIIPERPGLTNPIHDSQRIFRRLLEAMSFPGRICEADHDEKTPGTLNAATTAICLTMVDIETPLWLDPLVAVDAADYLRFHCGVQLVAEPQDAIFAVLVGTPVSLDCFNAGSDAFPESGATVIVQVNALKPDGAVVLAGPGIEGTTRLDVDGPDPEFWQSRTAVNRHFPRGIDVIFTTNRCFAALPRTVHAAIDGREKN